MIRLLVTLCTLLVTAAVFHFGATLAMILGPGFAPAGNYFPLKLGIAVGVILAIVINCFSFVNRAGAMRRSALIVGASLTVLVPVWCVFVWVVTTNTI